MSEDAAGGRPIRFSLQVAQAASRGEWVELVKRADDVSVYTSSEDPQRAVEWQAEMAEWPAVAAYKQRTCDVLADAGRVLDIGCEPGADLPDGDVNHLVALDRSIETRGHMAPPVAPDRRPVAQ